MKNPFRYRSYYYDFETNLYYLNSRYYDPETGRFVNADDIAILNSTKEVLNGLNLYTYCLNNPINEVDETGYAISWILALIISAIVFAVANTALQLASDVVGWAVTGKWTSGWEDYLGAFIGGFTGGLIYVATGGNFQLAFGAMNFMDTLSTNLITNSTGKTKDSLLDIFFKSAISGLFGLIMGKTFTKIPGITTGTNSFIAIFKSGITKLINNTAAKMSIKVLIKGIVGLIGLKSGGIFTSLIGILFQKIKQKF